MMSSAEKGWRQTRNWPGETGTKNYGREITKKLSKIQEKIELGDRPWFDYHFLIQLQDPEELLSSLSLVFQNFVYKKTKNTENKGKHSAMNTKKSVWQQILLSQHYRWSVWNFQIAAAMVNGCWLSKWHSLIFTLDERESIWRPSVYVSMSPI